MERTIYERAGGGSVARLSAPAASQRANCSSLLEAGLLCFGGRRGAARLSARWWRLLAPLRHVRSIDDGPEEAYLRLRLMRFFGF